MNSATFLPAFFAKHSFVAIAGDIYQGALTQAASAELLAAQDPDVKAQVASVTGAPPAVRRLVVVLNAAGRLMQRAGVIQQIADTPDASIPADIHVDGYPTTLA
jgi:hypothetical protein